MDNVINALKKEVEEAKNNNEIPVGAVIVDKNNNIISTGHNNRQNSYNVLGHAEINAIIAAGKYLKDWRLNGYSMYVNLEPCLMCSIIIKESRLDKVYYFVEGNNILGNNLGKYLGNNLDKSLGNILGNNFDNLQEKKYFPGNNLTINKEQIDVGKYSGLYEEFKGNILAFFRNKR